uniref:Uncharacterized protein n=1 Tax=Manihot esculenta TaxID=3983 RepID=A0A2C9W0N5_MANES
MLHSHPNRCITELQELKRQNTRGRERKSQKLEEDGMNFSYLNEYGLALLDLNQQTESDSHMFGFSVQLFIFTICFSKYIFIISIRLCFYN